MNTILLSLIFTAIGVGAVYFIVKISRSHTSEELKKIGSDIHKGIGKIELLQEEIKKLDGSYNLTPRGKRK